MVLSVTSARYQCCVYAKLLSGLKGPRMLFRVKQKAINVRWSWGYIIIQFDIMQFDQFTNIIQSCLAGTGAIAVMKLLRVFVGSTRLLPKHNKVRNKCIIFGVHVFDRNLHLLFNQCPSTKRKFDMIISNIFTFLSYIGDECETVVFSLSNNEGFGMFEFDLDLIDADYAVIYPW